MPFAIDTSVSPPVGGSLRVKLTRTGAVVLKDRSLSSRFSSNGKLIVEGNRIRFAPVKPIDPIAIHIEKYFKIAYPAIELPDQLPGVKKEKKLTMANNRKIRSLIMGMVDALQYGVENPWMVFLTITFPPAIDEKTAKKLLNIWLTRCGREGLIEQYLWRMEYQKNGTPHFHILVPHRVDVHKANNFMKASLITLYRRGKTPGLHYKQLKRYNGVDIAKERPRGADGKIDKQAKRGKTVNFALKGKAGALGYYLTKYITKKNQLCEGRQWGCSREWGSFFLSVNLTKIELLKIMEKSKVFKPDPLFSTNDFYFLPVDKGQDASFVTWQLGCLNYHVLRLFFDFDRGGMFKRRTDKPYYLNWTQGPEVEGLGFPFTICEN